ncbi:hypothetical protein K8I28_02075 [bacterium]|nr:hypothetical protein [bacterium]
MNNRSKDFLSMVPDYRAGNLSPREAHEVSRFLEENNENRQEAKREEMVVYSLLNMETLALPKGLVSSSVSLAVGESRAKNWFSLETLLLALGVGVICSAIAQFFAGKLFGGSFISKAVLDLSKLIAESSPFSFILTIWIVALGVLSAGIWYAFRVLRT